MLTTKDCYFQIKAELEKGRLAKDILRRLIDNMAELPGSYKLRVELTKDADAPTLAEVREVING